MHFIFAHKWYFQDLIDDWSAKSPPDLLYFVPYTWKFQFICKKFELVTSGNEYNWIDTSSTNQENALLAVCGEHLNIKFDLPSTGKVLRIMIIVKIRQEFEFERLNFPIQISRMTCC